MSISMKINTKKFGEIEIEEEKIIVFENGIIGFPDLKHFALIHDAEEGTNAGIRFLQSVEEPGFAMPVMDPLPLILSDSVLLHQKIQIRMPCFLLKSLLHFHPLPWKCKALRLSFCSIIFFSTCLPPSLCAL